MDGDGRQLRVATDGTKTWLVRYMIGGVERQYRLPKNYSVNSGVGFCSLQKARDESSIIRSLAREGIDYQVKLAKSLEAVREAIAAETKRLVESAILEQAEGLTVKEMFDAWLKDGVRRKDGNAELTRSFGVDVLPTIGSTAVKQISENELRDVLRNMVSRGVNRAAVTPP
jgi:hypothetical protein